jgi:hypothetical protein
MNFFLLGRPVYKEYEGNYLGTYRQGPIYIESLNENHPVNQFWRWYVEKKYENTLMDDDLDGLFQMNIEYKK